MSIWRGVAPLLAVVAGMSPALAQPAVPVQAATAQRADVPVYFRNIGSAQAYASVLVRARVDGTLDRVFFTEGQDVKAGQPLAQLDPRPYAAALAAAEAKKASDQAQVVNAKRDLGRYANLASRDFASRQQVDTQSASVSSQQATVEGDEAAIATARLNLEYAAITSPIEGRTGLRLVDPGNLVHASDAQGIVLVTQVHPISVVFTLPQQTLPALQAAMARGTAPVAAFTQDDATKLGDGTLLTIDNEVDQTTGTIKLKATFPNPDSRLWPGQFLNARIQVDTLKGVVTVPSRAVQRGPDGLYVFLVKPDMTAAQQPVSVKQDDQGVAVIDKGLDAGQQVVVDGESRLQNGTKLAIQQPKAAG